MMCIFKIQPNPSATPDMPNSLDPSPALLPFSIVPLVVRGPELDKGLVLWPHKGQVLGDNHFPGAAVLLIQARIPMAFLATGTHDVSCSASS